jgi:integrase
MINDNVTPMDWAPFQAEFLLLYSPTIRAASTREAMERALRALTKLGVASTTDLTMPLIARLIKAQPPKHSATTVRTLITRVSAVCRYAADAGYLRVSPFDLRKIGRWIRPSKRLPRNERYLTREEVRRLMAALERDVAERQGVALYRARRLLALVATFLYTGMRRDEVLWLQVQDVDLADRVILIVDRAENRLKTEDSAQPVPIVDRLLPYLVEWLAHKDDAPRGMTRTSIYLWPNWENDQPWVNGLTNRRPLGRLQAVARRAGIEGVTFQALRRTVATHMEESCSDAMITRILRHTSPETSRRSYRKRDLDNMHSAMDAFDY